jgi:Tfp pilus assembly protein PilF
LDKDNHPTYLTAFIGRSFLKDDERPWLEIRKILESLRPLGFRFKDAEEAQPRPISEKVQQGIESNDIYIGILTRRFPIHAVREAGAFKRVWHALSAPSPPTTWGPSSWVVQESGFALGKGKKVVLLIEDGVDFPKSDLDADKERILFERDQEIQCASRITAMIGNLISERLPPSAPAIAQTAAPPEPTQPSDTDDTTKGPTFQEITELLDQKRFLDADSLFDTLLKEAKKDFLQRWLKCMYLKEKAIRGHKASLQELVDLSQNGPTNDDALGELAEYYAQLDQHEEAGKVFYNACSIAPPKLKAGLLRSAARAYGKGENYEVSFATLREALAVGIDRDDEKLNFGCLADLAGKQRNRNLEAAALESVLEIEPTDSDARFRLAYLYGEMNKNGLSAYHYRLRLAQSREPLTLNNYGVALGRLELHSLGIESFIEASTANPLAKANLSHAYIDGGFLAEAETFAKDAASHAAENVGRTRAAEALERIAAVRSSEQERLANVVGSAKGEIEFRAKYAWAFMHNGVDNLNGKFKTPHGRIEFVQKGDELTGGVEFLKESGNGSSVKPADGSIKADIKEVRTIRINGKIMGLSGTLELRLRTNLEDPYRFALPSPAPVRGYCIIAPDGKSLEILEEREKAVEIYTATRLEI